MSTPAVNMTLLLVCGTSLSKLSKLTTRDISIGPGIRKAKAVIRSIETLEKDPLKKRMLGECLTRLTQAEKALAKDESLRSFNLTKELLRKASIGCRVVADMSK